MRDVQCFALVNLRLLLMEQWLEYPSFTPLRKVFGDYSLVVEFVLVSFEEIYYYGYFWFQDFGSGRCGVNATFQFGGTFWV